jgi:hypothetical protein
MNYKPGDFVIFVTQYPGMRSGHGYKIGEITEVLHNEFQTPKEFPLCGTRPLGTGRYFHPEDVVPACTAAKLLWGLEP